MVASGARPIKIGSLAITTRSGIPCGQVRKCFTETWVVPIDGLAGGATGDDEGICAGSGCPFAGEEVGAGVAGRLSTRVKEKGPKRTRVFGNHW